MCLKDPNLNRFSNFVEKDSLNFKIDNSNATGSYTEVLGSVTANNNNYASAANTPSKDHNQVSRPKRFPKQKTLELYSRCEGSDSGNIR